MRRLLILVGLLMWISFVQAASVPQNEAKMIALNWINSVGNSFQEMDDIFNVEAELEGGDTLYYIVSFKPAGWVIVSGTNCVEPVLGYSATTTFSMDGMPPQIKGWMGGMNEKVKSAIVSKLHPTLAVSKKWKTYGEKIIPKKSLKSLQVAEAGPLLSTTWNQGRYYNEMAPEDSRSTTGNGHVWLGCVATAMAQIMKFWEFPESGMGSHSYNSSYGALSANFAGATYLWDMMPNDVSSLNTEVQEIGYHCAVSVNMNFSANSSGAYLENACSSFMDYFKYNSTAFEAYKGDWDEQEWLEQMRRDIDAGRPILYSGYNASKTSGHAWVCDGYSGDYFHFNWGWSGSYNGNFLLSSLTPGSSNYSYIQGALFSIEPIENTSIHTPFIEGFESFNPNEIRVMGISSVSTAQQHIGSSSLLLGKPSVSCRSTNAASLCFTVPSDAGLNFWVKRYTPSVSGTNQQKAFIMPQYGTTPLVEIFNGDYNDSDWVNYNVDLAAYEGQVVRLLFVEEKNDLSKQQWMYIDDIAISGERVNLAPYGPSNPTPSNKATDILFTPTLSWSGGDPNGDDLTYNVYLGTNPNPPLVASVFKNSYTTSALEHTTTYYWKVVSDDGVLSTESPVWSFTTRGIPPTMESCGVDEITSTSAKMCGKILSYNKSTVLSRGVCWSQHQSPTINNSFTESTESTDEYTCQAVGLLPNTTYYYSAYANSNQGVAYGEEVSFKTLPALASVSVANVSNILRSSATVTGNISAVNDSFVFRRGIVWSTVAGFDPADGKVVAQEGIWTAPGVFTFGLTGLPGPGTFYYRVFAENSVGISYSDEANFTTKNTAPSIDLDSDNSKGVVGSDFKTFSTEQMPGTFICDSDAVFVDVDGDVIVQLVCEIINPSDPNFEILSVSSDNKNLIVSGNKTGKLTISSSKALSNKEWTNVLRSIEYRNNQDSPHPEVVRKVQVKVADNLDISNLATAFITMVQVNDPPVNQVKPTLNVAPVFNTTVSVVPGSWDDLLDECDGTFSYSYSWQVKDENGKIMDIDSANREELFVDESFCSKWIRVVEKVTDQNCGGSNVAINQAEGKWNLVGKAAQTLVLDPIPSHYFSEGYFTLSGNASSGLPVTYSVPKNKYIFISNDTVYIQNAGTIIVSGIQPGDDCYQPSPLLYKVVNIEKSGQSILYDEKVESTYDVGKMKVPAEATSHLGLTAISSDPAIALVENDTIFFRNTGSVTLTISQEGDENYDPATPVVQQLIIEKGNQQIVGETDRVLYYGSGNRLLNFVSSSSLEVSVASSNSSILDVQNDSLLIRGVGQVLLTVSQQGNNLWNAAENVEIPILVKKGIQKMEVDSIGDQVFNGAPFIPVERSSSGLEVTYSVRDTSVADVVAGQVVIKNVGETFIDFIQNGDSYWEPTSVAVPLKVLKADQTITFNPIESQVYGAGSVALSAMATSGLQVAFESSNSDVATVSGDSLIIHNAGEAIITASQPGNRQYNQAHSVSVNFVVGKASQSIISHLPDSILFDHQVIFADVTSTSGLDVGILSSDEKVIKVISDSLYVVGAGEATLVLSQPGDRNYFPAQASAIIVVSERVGVSTVENTSISVYPNPTAGRADLRVDGALKEPLLISIVNSTGQTITMFETNAIINPIDLSTQPPGLYFIIVRSQSIHKAQKLLITR